MEQKSEKQFCVVITRDYVKKCVIIEKEEKDSGLIVDTITFTKDEFLKFKELIKDMDL